MGVSEVSLLVAAACWTFLWGPIGLVLSNPMMLCLVVLGKYVPQFEFLSLLVANEPALQPEFSYYQRLLARDQDEATELVLEQVRSHPVQQVYDEVLIPALSYARRDRERDVLTESDDRFILGATQEIIQDLSDRRLAREANNELPQDASRVDRPRVRILGCPARDDADRLAVGMLQELLDVAKWDMEITAVESLTSEVVELVAEREPALICIGCLPPGGLAHTRYLCKRLRTRFPKARILIGRWGLKGNVEQNGDRLREAGADIMTTTLLETCQQLNSLHPILVEKQSPKIVMSAMNNWQPAAV